MRTKQERWPSKIGQRFGKLVILDLVEIDNRKYYQCQCDCGNVKNIYYCDVHNGSHSIRSCGCSRKGKVNVTHGMAKTRFWSIWLAMKFRYRAKGYERFQPKACERWLKFENFKEDMYEEYLAHVAEYGEKQTTLDRINGRLGYSPENCRWATYKVQNNNQIRANA